MSDLIQEVKLFGVDLEWRPKAQADVILAGAKKQKKRRKPMETYIS